jgi:hypothetical protein
VKRVLAAIAGVAIVLVGTTAVAAWLSSGSAIGTATATSVNQANAPSATRDDGGVLITWTASAMADGSAVGGYQVVRHSGASSTVVCTVTSPGCVDTSPLPGAVTYGVVATAGTRWTGPESDTTPFTYDDQAPVTSASVSPLPNAAGWSKAAVTVTLTALDGGSGVDHITYAVDGASPVTVNASSTSFPVSGTGSHTILFHAFDNAGNVETEHGQTVRIDPTAPVTSVTSNPVPNGDGWNNTDVQLSFTSTDSGTSGVKQVVVDGVATPGASATRTVSAEGTTTVHYNAVDVADNAEGDKSVTVNIDKTAPSASITPTSDATAWRTTTGATITATDALSGPAGISYKLNGAATFTTTAGSSATVSGLVQGTNTIVYRATDVAGNVSADQTATIKVDTEVPNAALSQTGGGQPTLSGTDATSGVASVSWRDGGTGSGGYTTVSGSSTTLSLSNGAHTIWYYATDNAGNASTATSQVVTVNVDTTAPTISNVEPGNESGGWASISCSVAGSARKVCATVSDNVGVSSVTMTLQKSNGRYWDGGTTSNFVDTTTAIDVPMSLSAGLWATNSLTRDPSSGAGKFTDASYTLTIKATDAAGNTTTVTRTFTVAGS